MTLSRARGEADPCRRSFRQCDRAVRACIRSQAFTSADKIARSPAFFRKDPSCSADRFHGGTGKAGRQSCHGSSRKDDILNVDLKPLDRPGVNTLIADVTDGAQVFNALTTHFGFEGFEAGKPPAPVDAVVHFAAIPRVLIEPDNETFRVNVMSTYNVIEAAMKLGIRKVVIASTETTYGVCFAEGDKDFHLFRWKRTTTSIRWTATGCRRSSTKRPRGPSPCAAAPTSMRCDRQCHRAA